MSLRLVLLATSEFAIPTLQALQGGPDQLLAVFTRPDRPAGRGRRLRGSPVKLAAQALGLPVHQPARVSVGEGLEQLKALAPDVLLVAAFGEILRPEVLALPRARAGQSARLLAAEIPRRRADSAGAVGG